jgi:hypothetical protein
MHTLYRSVSCGAYTTHRSGKCPRKAVSSASLRHPAATASRRANATSMSSTLHEDLCERSQVLPVALAAVSGYRKGSGCLIFGFGSTPSLAAVLVLLLQRCCVQWRLSDVTQDDLHSAGPCTSTACTSSVHYVQNACTPCALLQGACSLLLSASASHAATEQPRYAWCIPVLPCQHVAAVLMPNCLLI